MPTFSYSIKELEKLTGEKLSKLKEHFESLKLEEEIEGNEIVIEFKDANRPELWAIEILARELRARLGKKVKDYSIEKSKWQINVDKELKHIRPYIAAIVIKNVNIDENFLKYLIQLQEAIAENYGRKRKQVSIGIYDFDKVNWPVSYKAVKPDAIKFIPLDMDTELNLRQILKKHEKGIKYKHLLEGFEKYPILIDSSNNVLSFPPIINSNYSGKVEVGKRNLMVEVTGLQEDFISHAIDVFARVFLERGYKVYSVAIDYGKEKKHYPEFKEIKVEVSKEAIDIAFARELSKKDIENLARRFLARVKFGKKLTFIYPSYRYDIKGQDDVVEDLLINYGYDKFKPKTHGIEEISHGSEAREHMLYRRIASIMASVGEEVLTGILSNPSFFREMIRKKYKLVEVANPISQNYSALRNYIYPCHLHFLSLNKHVNLPIKIFEIGKVVKIVNARGKDIENKEEKGEIKEEIHLAYTAIGPEITFTNAKQDLEFLFKNLGIKEYSIKPIEHESFINGRIGSIIVNGKEIGFIGEIHPAVLSNFGLIYTTLVFEIDLGFLLGESQ